MNKREFSLIRHYLGRTQTQMAQLLGVSLKAVQSFEQGWRNIPVHTERQSLLLLALKKGGLRKMRPCWSVKKCSPATRKHCPSWEFGAGQICWLINGNVCEAETQKNWTQKMKMCRKCEVFSNVLSSITAK